MSYIQSAINSFEENLRLFSNAQTEPEKYNLYNGLSELAHAIQRLKKDVADIKRKIGD